MVAGVKRIGSKVTDMFVDWTKADDAARIEGTKRLGLPKNNTAQDRAKAMGFGDDVYHGTNDEFTAFKDQNTFVSPDPNVANSFTGVHDVDIANGRTQELLETYGDTFKPRMMPLKTRGNVFDYENPEHLKLLEDEIGPQIFGVKKGLWQDLEAKPVQEGIRKLGYDGFRVKEKPRTTTNTGIFNNTDIRSKFAHFNPKYAGVGPGSILSAELMAEENNTKPTENIWSSLMNTIGNVNQQQAQAYGDTGANTMGGAASLASMLATDPAVAAEVIGTVGLKGIGAVSPYIKGFGLGLLLDAKEMGDGEIPNFEERLFAGEFHKKRVQ
tara:strand:+ start:118 stop:1095 length:978 start_codon:yes stop_codon:yes gene_type:complete